MLMNGLSEYTKKQRKNETMTLEKFLIIPYGMDFVEYEEILKKKKRIEKRLYKVSEMIDGEECSLDVLSDEIGSERYSRHFEEKQKLEIKQKKLLEELKLLKAKL